MNYPRGTLYFVSGTWLDATTYLGTYRVTDVNTLSTTTQVKVSGARDRAGNVIPTQTFNNPFTVEMRNPAVVSIRRVGAARVAAGAAVQFRVTFSEAVTGVDLSDFRLAAGAPRGAAIVRGAAESPKSYLVTVRAGSGSGLLRLFVRDNNTIKNLVGNLLGGARLGDGDFTRREPVSVG